MLGGVAGLVQPLAARTVIDALGAGAPLLTPLLILGAVVMLGALIGAFGEYVLQRAADSVVLGTRVKLLRHILRLKLSAFDTAQPGDLMCRVTSDTTLLREAATRALVNLVTETFILAGVIVMMGVMDLVLLGVTVGVLAVIGAVVGVMMPRISRAAKDVQEAVGQMGSALERVLGAFRTIKASGAEDREIAVVEGAADRAFGHGMRVAKWQALVGVSTGLAIQLSLLAVLGVGGARVASGGITVSTLVAFLLYLFYLGAPISQLVMAITTFQSGTAALGRINEVEQLPTEPEAPSLAMTPIALSAAPAAVHFEDEAFRYRDDAPTVHHGVTFEIPPGGMTAFVGPSGSGKSTVFALIERLYEPERGVVTVDGRNVADWPLHELRAQIGYVEQDAPVLAGTLRDNLRLAAPTATDDEIRRAPARTRLTGFLERLPDGLDTIVGHRGSTLSGGERQRVAIARALLRQPRLLLLDEATSQLDAVNELALREIIAEVSATTTVLVVAHRLSTVTLADRIIVMDAGVVRGIGTHAELVAGDDLYRELATTRLLAVANEDEDGAEASDPEPVTVDIEHRLTAAAVR
ncbi:MAG: ABC transporter ATP-binding protein/permease [Chloroflexota bacterium]|nr:ABC transporter ATP-binding protein/permease [Chloroflexota bacterium]